MRQEHSSNESDWQHHTNQAGKNGRSEAHYHDLHDASLEKHYSISEVSKLWGLSEKTIRRIFDDEPGIVVLGNDETQLKRTYLTRRIPESVLKRVHRRLRKSA